MPESIEPASLEQAEAIVAVHIACWRQNYRGLMDQAALDGIVEIEWLERRKKHLVNPERVKLVALDDAGGIVGFCDGGPPRDPGTFPAHAEVYALYVRPGVQGGGVGKRLFAATYQALANLGYEKFYVKTLGTNPQSRAFYEARGGELCWEGFFEFAGKKYPEVAYRYEIKI